MNEQIKTIEYNLNKYWEPKRVILLYDKINNITSLFEWINDYKDEYGHFRDDNYNDDDHVDEMVEKCYANLPTLAKVIVEHKIDYTEL